MFIVQAGSSLFPKHSLGRALKLQLAPGCLLGDSAILQADDVTMVCRKERAEEVKALLARVQDREELRRYL